MIIRSCNLYICKCIKRVENCSIIIELEYPQVKWIDTTFFLLQLKTFRHYRSNDVYFYLTRTIRFISNTYLLKFLKLIDSQTCKRKAYGMLKLLAFKNAMYNAKMKTQTNNIYLKYLWMVSL